MTAPRPTREGLPPDVRALLRADREHAAITDEARFRLGTRLAASVAAFGAPPAPPAAPSPITGPTPHGPLAFAAKATGLGAAGAKVAVALALTATAIVGGQRWLDAPRETTPVHVTATAATTPTAASVAPVPASPPEDPPIAASPTEPIAATAIAAPPAHRPRRAATAPATATMPPAIAPVPGTPSEHGGLREEQELLEEARADLDRGDASAALAATDAHAMRFPGGVLAEAGDALRIRALVRLGRTEDANLAIATFRAHHPRSLLLGIPTNP